jgi:hypothetical protein
MMNFGGDRRAQLLGAEVLTKRATGHANSRGGIA